MREWSGVVKIKMKKEKITTLALGVLLVVVVFQTLQLNVMANKISAQETELGELETNVKTLAEADLTTGGFSGGSANLALDKLKELPQMVGGC